VQIKKGIKAADFIFSDGNVQKKLNIIGMLKYMNFSNWWGRSDQGGEWPQQAFENLGSGGLRFCQTIAAF
jgi:hypothetical protein